MTLSVRWYKPRYSFDILKSEMKIKPPIHGGLHLELISNLETTTDVQKERHRLPTHFVHLRFGLPFDRVAADGWRHVICRRLRWMVYDFTHPKILICDCAARARTTTALRSIYRFFPTPHSCFLSDIAVIGVQHDAFKKIPAQVTWTKKLAASRGLARKKMLFPQILTHARPNTSREPTSNGQHIDYEARETFCPRNPTTTYLYRLANSRLECIIL